MDVEDTVPSVEEDTTETEKTSKDKPSKLSKKNKKGGVEEYHIDPDKILKYARGGRVKTKVDYIFNKNITNEQVKWLLIAASQ